MDGGNATMRWVWWAVGAVISFVVVAVAVFGFETNPALLFGWAVGMIVGAMLLVFKRGG